MAKKKAPVIYVKGDSSLIKHNLFVYEIEIYINAKNTFYLYDTRTITLRDFKHEGVYRSFKENYQVVAHYKLLAAPQSWLEDERYTLSNDQQNISRKTNNKPKV